MRFTNMISMSINNTLGPKVYKYDLHWAIWSLRVWKLRAGCTRTRQRAGGWTGEESMRGIMMSCAISEWRILEFYSEGKHNLEKSLMMKGRGFTD